MLSFEYKKKFDGGLTLHLKGEVRGERLVAVLGPSGSGKTSLANFLAGLVRPDSGRCVVNGVVFDDTANGVRLEPQDRQVGFVFQNHRLFPYLNVADNIKYPVRFGKRTPLIPFDDLVQVLHIEHLLDRMPASLSGGEAQRVSLARALSSAQRMLILDEPTASLDPRLRQELVGCVREIARRSPLPILYITHAAKEALELAAVSMFIADGKVVDTGPTEDVLRRHGYLCEIAYA